jgi:hypothetical protein
MTSAFGDRDRSPPGRRLLPWILVWLLVVLIVAAMIVRQEAAASFTNRARAAQGEVIAREPNNHATVRARYEVAGISYEVNDSFIGPPNPDFDAVRVGDRVTVFYDPESPSRAVLAQPQTRTVNENSFALLASLALATLFVGALALSLPLWKRALRRPN